jgi:fatty acid desaturase
MFRNFSEMHEAVHGIASEKKWLNDLTGVMSGALCLLPFSQWRTIHLQHHYWSGNIEKDPVMALVRRFPLWPERVRKLCTFFWQIWIPILSIFQYFVFWFHCTKCLLKDSLSPLAVSSVLSTPIIWSICIFMMRPGSFLSVILPAAALYLIAVEVVNFPHHLGLPQNQGDTKLPVWEQHLTARSCIYPRFFSRFVVLNFNYHVEHHMFPDAPWYYLSELHSVIFKELEGQYNSDPQFGWIMRNRPRSLEEVLVTAPDQKPSIEEKAA